MANSSRSPNSGVNTWRRPAAALWAGGAAIFLAGLAATPWEQERSAASYHDALAAAPAQAQFAALLLWCGYAALAAGAFALIGLLGGVRTWPTRLAAVLVVLGSTTLPGLLVTDAYDLALAQELPRAESAQVSDAVTAMVLPSVLGVVAMLGLLVGPTILWWAVARERIVPLTVPVLITASWMLGMVSTQPVVMLAGAAVLVLGSSLAATVLWPARPVAGIHDAAGPGPLSSSAGTATVR